MSMVMILFAFTLSLVINFIEKILYPSDHNADAEKVEALSSISAEQHTNATYTQSPLPAEQ